NKNIKFNSIVFKENNNKISIKDLTLNNKFKVLDLELLDLLFVNDSKINNQMTLSKKGKNYLLEGSSFDASKMLDSMFNNDSDVELSNLLENFNTNLDIKIKKVYLDSEYSVNNFKGTLSLIKSEIDKLEIKSFFKNNKILIASINHLNDEKVTTLYSDYARPFVKKYKFIRGFEEGSLDFHSVKKDKITSARLKIYDFKLKELPGLTKLLTLASLQGIADTLSGEGIRFNDFEMKYKSNKKLMTVDEIYALGPAISILMDGYIEKDKLVSLRGTLVPATTINKVIGSIPLLGNILVGKKAGEGVFGVSFKIKGPPKDLKTSVNPIKTLTPRFITRTLEKVKKE
ncbi:AsmA-like C-terminal domain-containing protein, partial [Candidatus Pelagibacter sp.]|nr:AsmA-like C-terminal domain-containing protein [Candidatus Pelagibacter sp.]